MGDIYFIMKIKAKDFVSRVDLDTYVKNEIGTNIDENRKTDNSIEGTAAELSKLSLSYASNVWGVKVVLLQDN